MWNQSPQMTATEIDFVSSVYDGARSRWPTAFRYANAAKSRAGAVADQNGLVSAVGLPARTEQVVPTNYSGRRIIQETRVFSYALLRGDTPAASLRSVWPRDCVGTTCIMSDPVIH